MRISQAIAVSLSFLMVCVAHGNPLGSDGFAGRFANDRLTVDLQPAGDGYSGMLTLDGKSFPAKATRNGDNLSGTFNSGGQAFSFTATLAGTQLTFTSGKRTFTLARVSENGAAAKPVAGNANPPSGYAVVNSSDYGQALAAQKPGANSIQATLQSTLPEINHLFDAPATVLTAYEDTRDPSVGGATFTAVCRGHRMKGWVTCKLSQQGATVAVIYCRSDAPPAEWSKLLNVPSGQGMPKVELRELRFPDGTGSIGIAEGWTTDAQSCMGPVTIKGPNDQEIVLGNFITVVTPDSMAVRTQMQLMEQARQLGGPPPQLSPMLVAPFTDPAQAVVNLMPQVSELIFRSQGIRVAIDNLQELQKVNPMLPNARAAILTYGVTLGTNAGQAHYKALCRTECTPVGADSWMMSTSSVRAPDATFDQDLPVMLAMYGSVRENVGVIQQKTNENIDAMNQRFAAQQKAHRELVAAYEQSNRNWEHNQTIQSRSADNFSEAMRGYRTVEDTVTGERTSVDLGNVDQIVDTLNEHDPDRFRQIPLRDENNPLPANR